MWCAYQGSGILTPEIISRQEVAGLVQAKKAKEAPTSADGIAGPVGQCKEGAKQSNIEQELGARQGLGVAEAGCEQAANSRQG